MSCWRYIYWIVHASKIRSNIINMTSSKLCPPLANGVMGCPFWTAKTAFFIDVQHWQQVKLELCKRSDYRVDNPKNSNVINLQLFFYGFQHNKFTGIKLEALLVIEITIQCSRKYSEYLEEHISNLEVKIEMKNQDYTARIKINYQFHKRTLSINLDCKLFVYSAILKQKCCSGIQLLALKNVSERTFTYDFYNFLVR